MKLPLMTKACAFLFLLSGISMAAELHIGEFSTGSLAGWSDKIFKGKTSYTLFSENNITVLKAHSVRSASGLIKKTKINTM